MEIIEQKIQEKIDDIRVFLNIEGGDIEYIKYEDGYVYVKLLGHCANCDFGIASMIGSNSSSFSSLLIIFSCKSK